MANESLAGRGFDQARSAVCPWQGRRLLDKGVGATRAPSTNFKVFALVLAAARLADMVFSSIPDVQVRRDTISFKGLSSLGLGVLVRHSRASTSSAPRSFSAGKWSLTLSMVPRLGLVDVHFRRPLRKVFARFSSAVEVPGAATSAAAPAGTADAVVLVARPSPPSTAAGPP